VARCDSLGPLDLHLWLCRREQVASSAAFSREVLSRYAPVAPDDWQFRVGKYGKPRIANAPIALDFNLSHSRDWLVCAVTAGSAIGVDIEYCDPAREFSKLARRFYQPQEYEALEAMPAADRCARFYDLWTLKEARVKAGGGALGNQLSSLGFTLLSPAPGGGQSGPAGIVEVLAPGRNDTGIVEPARVSAPSRESPHSHEEPQSQKEPHYSLFDLPENDRLASCVLHARAGLPQLALYGWWGGDDVRPAYHTMKARSSTRQRITG